MIYGIIITLAILLGQMTRHLSIKLIPVLEEKIGYKEFFKTFCCGFHIDFKNSILFLFLYYILYRLYGNTGMMYLYMALLPILFIVFSIDYQVKLIPDEAHIYIVILGIIQLMFRFHQLLDFILGALIGGGFFLAISLISYWILKKEGMGLGDVKLMASLGFLFGTKTIMVIILLSFILGAIAGVVVLAIKKGKESYIAFGPFIVIATIIIMIIPVDDIIQIYFSFCSALGTAVTDLVFFLLNH